MKKVFVFLIKFYRKYISSHTIPVCRFTPTCSRYALECLEKYSLHKALLKITSRVMRCHPFSKGGYDPS